MAMQDLFQGLRPQVLQPAVLAFIFLEHSFFLQFLVTHLHDERQARGFCFMIFMGFQIHPGSQSNTHPSNKV